MKFEYCKIFTLISPDKTTKRKWNRDDFCIFLYNNQLEYKYIPKTKKKGLLELYNDSICMEFDVILHH